MEAAQGHEEPAQEATGRQDAACDVGDAVEEALQGPPSHGGQSEPTTALVEDCPELVVRDLDCYAPQADLKSKSDEAGHEGHTLVGYEAEPKAVAYRQKALECLADPSEGGIAADGFIYVHNSVKALASHQPCCGAGDADAGCAKGAAPKGQGYVNVPPPIDHDAEEGQGEGGWLRDVGRLKTCRRSRGRPPLALLDEAPPEVRHTGEVVGVWDAKVLPPGNTRVHTMHPREREVDDDAALAGRGLRLRHDGAALSPLGEGRDVKSKGGHPPRAWSRRSW